jgi:hypothetical protein
MHMKCCNCVVSLRLLRAQRKVHLGCVHIDALHRQNTCFGLQTRPDALFIVFLPLGKVFRCFTFFSAASKLFRLVWTFYPKNRKKWDCGGRTYLRLSRSPTVVAELPKASSKSRVRTVHAKGAECSPPFPAPSGKSNPRNRQSARLRHHHRSTSSSPTLRLEMALSSAMRVCARVRIPVCPEPPLVFSHELLGGLRTGFLVDSPLRIACVFLHWEGDRSSDYGAVTE